MSNLLHIDNDYKNWIQDLSKRFRQSQIKASVKVNSELLQFYWSLGKDMVEMNIEDRWGQGVMRNLSMDLQDKMPDAKCFSPTNLYYIKKFYVAYNEIVVILPQVGVNLYSIPWGHHKLILDKLRDNPEKALFFVEQTIQNNWSRAVLLNFLSTNLYERQGKAITNFKETLPELDSDLAQQITKDPYNFNFLSMTNDYREKELKDALINNVEKFLLELGRGFAYMGREYRIDIGGEEKFIDMLFYNVPLHCYVVVEIKTGKFNSDNVGQLGTYVVAVNHQLNTDRDNPAIGLLICKEKNDVLAKYALESTSQPLGISQYELSNLYPEEFKGSLPTIEEIENELNNR